MSAVERSGDASRLLVFRISFFLGAACIETACAAAGDGERDVVPASRDVVGGVAAMSTTGTYEYVARRPLAVVALAEGRGVDPAVARAAIDQLADRLDACVTTEAHKDGPVEGAARVVAEIDTTGNVARTTVRIDPGHGGASTAVVCLVAPMKLLAFPPSDHSGRGIAVEALWGHVQAAPSAP